MTRDEVFQIIKKAREKGEQADLHGADLHGADLRFADLYRSDLYRSDLREANLSMADMLLAYLRGVNLSMADLSMTDLTDRIIQIGPIGSRKDYICYNATLDEMICGCFFGTLADFKESVRKTHGTSKHAREYLAMVRFLEEIMEINRMKILADEMR